MRRVEGVPSAYGISVALCGVLGEEVVGAWEFCVVEQRQTLSQLVTVSDRDVDWAIAPETPETVTV
jgi:hypothetical protein